LIIFYHLSENYVALQKSVVKSVDLKKKSYKEEKPLKKD